MSLTWATSSLAIKGAATVTVAATTDAIVGAAATTVVGFLAALSAITVAWIQSRSNTKRDEAAQEMVELATKLTALESDRAQRLADELDRVRANHPDDKQSEGDTH